MTTNPTTWYQVVVLVDGKLHDIDARGTIEAARKLRDDVWGQWQMHDGMTNGRRLLIIAI